MAGRRIAMLGAGALALLATSAAAHDFWIDLPAYRVAPGASLPVRLLIGDMGAVEPWETLWRKIVSFRSYGSDGVVDQQATLRMTTGDNPGGATVALRGEGTHILAFESYQAENDIAAAEFNAYAEHEGLTPALDARRRAGKTGERGRELYSRRAKALIQIGARRSGDATRVIGQTLELVPERNPYTLAAGEPLTIMVRYRGMPLAGASVVLEPLDGASGQGIPQISDAAGRVRFAMPGKGRRRVGTVWTQPIEHPRAEFDTIFASLTFGS